MFTPEPFVFDLCDDEQLRAGAQHVIDTILLEGDEGTGFLIGGDEATDREFRDWVAEILSDPNAEHDELIEVCEGLFAAVAGKDGIIAAIQADVTDPDDLAAWMLFIEDEWMTVEESWDATLAPGHFASSQSDLPTNDDGLTVMIGGQPYSLAEVEQRLKDAAQLSDVAEIFSALLEQMVPGIEANIGVGVGANVHSLANMRDLSQALLQTLSLTIPE